MGAFGHQRETDRGADDAVRPRNGQFEESGRYQPDATSAESGQVAQHQLRIGIVVDARVDDAFAHRVRHLVT